MPKIEGIFKKSGLIIGESVNFNTTMSTNYMVKFCRFFLFITLAFLLLTKSYAQVNAVQFGKNRLQFRTFPWQYYQSRNFNVYFYDNGEELAKFVAQCAEKELTGIEEKAEYSLQRRANIVVYNDFTDYRQSNIGLETYTLSTGGTAKLVNNKIILYFDANHDNLKKQIRHGIADVLMKNMLFGDDLGEVAGNQTLLNFPAWLTDGYIDYLGENWSTSLDDDLKSEILGGKYKKFSSLAYDKPLLAGHAFWYFFEEKYKKENTTYLLYLARIYKNLNKASIQITKKKFKDLLTEFMEYEEEKYYDDITRRRAFPKGNFVESFDVNKRLNYSRFNVNPNKRNNSYVVTQFNKGIIRVLLNNDFEFKTLLKYGTRTYENETNPLYPMAAWDPKGTRVCVVYAQEGRLKMFIYDVEKDIKTYKFDLSDKFDQIQDVKYMIDSRTLLFSAVKNGHSDIFTFNIEKEKLVQITDDVYDDVDASFVAFHKKTGIIFSSNRPTPNVKGSDTSLPSNNRFNVFMVTDYSEKAEINQITQLSNLKYGNARYPMQYNSNHFTFISDENGIANRYAGFFATKSAGADTLILIGDDILRNPSIAEIDSTLRAQKKTEIDSMVVARVSEDSAYTFPLSNYPSNLAETRIAGDNNQVSEVTRQSDEKILYKLKIDETTLNRRNITAPPTEYMKKLMRESKLTKVAAASQPKEIVKQEDVFQSEFNTSDSSHTDKTPLQVGDDASILSFIKKYIYNPKKFSADVGSVGFNNDVLVNRYQAYQGGSGPISLNSGTPLNGLIRLGTSDLMEDVRVVGGFKLSTNLKDNEWLIGYQNLRRRLDWSGTYYRNVQAVNIVVTQNGIPFIQYPGKVSTNLYQGSISYPFDENRRIKLNSGIRSDNLIPSSVDSLSASLTPEGKLYSVSHLEYVYDNTLNPTMNIWNGMRYKFYFDWNRQVSKVQFSNGPNTFNFGFDARYYYPIYKDFIWAGRAAGDFSWGNQKMIYYLGGVDGWLMFGSNQKTTSTGITKDRYFNTNNPPANDQDYAFQSLAVNMRGYIQNVANGNNAIVMNSEFRMPVMSTLFDKVVTNAFLQNLQIVQFIDLGTAWNGAYGAIKRPSVSYNSGNINVKIKTGGVGPFAGGYGFGARSTLLGYFLKFDVSWPMNGFFKGAPVTYFALGLDF
jgi:hypothetical protein